MERVSAHLQHSNGAVVLASIRVLMKQLEVCRGTHTGNSKLTSLQVVSQSVRHSFRSQISSSLVTLLGAESEVQFIALQNVLEIVDSYTEEFRRHLQVRAVIL